MAQRPPEFSNESDAPPPSSPRPPSVALWAVMASLAAIYLLVMSVRPSFLEGYLPVANAELADAAARTDAELVHVRDTVAQVQTDVRNIQSDIANQADRERALADRVTALEQGTAPQAAPQAGPQHNSDALPEGGDQPRVLNSQNLETGSVDPGPAAPAAKPKAPAATTAAAPPPPKPKPVGIKLASGSVEHLRTSWDIISQRHSSELGPLQPRYSNGADAETFDLVAGPIKSTADAKKLCKELQAQAIACTVGNYNGKPL